MLALLGALREEIADIKKEMVAVKREPVEAFPAYLGKLEEQPVLLVQTGMGGERAEAAARFVIERYSPSALVSFGFCGALGGGLAAGDIILGSELCCDGKDEPLSPDSGLLSRAERAAPPGVTLRRGKSVAVSSVVGTPDKKRALGETSGADIVDMESYWVARMAFDKGVPFLSVRAVLDTTEDRLPPFERLNSAGEAARYFAMRPRELANLIGLYRKMRRARRSLSRFLIAMVREYEEG